MLWDILFPVIAFIIGIIVGTVITGFYIKRKLGPAMNGQMDEKQIANIARSMGVNLNQKQMNMINKKMSSMNNKPNKQKKKK